MRTGIAFGRVFRQGIRRLCLAVLIALVSGVASPAAAQDDSATVDPNAQALADKYAPIVYLAKQSEPCDKKGEAYFPTRVETVLGNEQVGLMDGDPVEEVARGATAPDVFRLSEESY